MLWPLPLPVKITFWLLLAILLVATVAVPLISQKRRRVFSWGILLGALAFMPSCVGVMSVLDHYRFGVFAQPDFQSVTDIRVQRCLPEAATDITVEQRRTGFRARFKIKKQELDEWLDRFWEQYGERSIAPRGSNEESEPIHPDEFRRHFADLGWTPPLDAIKHEGPRAGNGAGFTIWYSESQGVAYQRAGYW